MTQLTSVLVLLCCLTASVPEQSERASQTQPPNILVDSFVVIDTLTGERFAVAKLCDPDLKPIGFNLIVEGDEENRAVAMRLQWSVPQREIYLMRQDDDIVVVTQLPDQASNRLEQTFKPVTDKARASKLFDLGTKFFVEKFKDNAQGRVPQDPKDPLFAIFGEIVKLSRQTFSQEWEIQNGTKRLIARGSSAFFIYPNFWQRGSVW